jgi:hypothetical protein
LLGGRALEYLSLIRQRSPLLVENLLLSAAERAEMVVGATITDYNFTNGRSALHERGVSCIGIRARSDGATDYGRTVREMKAPPTPLEELFRDANGEDKVQERQKYSEWRRKLRGAMAITAN